MGTLYVVATPIGNLGDITFRAVEILKMVDAILCEDTRCSLKLCNHFNINKPLYAYHKFNENAKKNFYIEELKKGKNLALISDAGTPCISDPGYILVKEARMNNIKVVPIGGISAVISALSVGGIDTSSFAFFGFFPREKRDQESLITKLKDMKVASFIFYESPKRILKTFKFLNEKVPDSLVCLGSDITKLHEKFYYGKVLDVLKQLEENPNSELGEYTLILENPYLDKIKEEEGKLSLEAMLVDILINEKVTLKEAVLLCKKLNPNLKKKDLYQAMLNLKDLH